MWRRIRLPGCLINFGRREWISKEIMLIRIPSEANVHNIMNIASFDTIFYLMIVLGLGFDYDGKFCNGRINWIMDYMI